MAGTPWKGDRSAQRGDGSAQSWRNLSETNKNRPDSPGHPPVDQVFWISLNLKVLNDGGGLTVGTPGREPALMACSDPDSQRTKNSGSIWLADRQRVSITFFAFRSQRSILIKCGSWVPWRSSSILRASSINSWGSASWLLKVRCVSAPSFWIRWARSAGSSLQVTVLSWVCSLGESASTIDSAPLPGILKCPREV